MANLKMTWPWLSDMSLMTSTYTIFVPPKPQLNVLPTQPRPWLYFNTNITNTTCLFPATEELYEAATAAAETRSADFSAVRTTTNGGDAANSAFSGLQEPSSPDGFPDIAKLRAVPSLSAAICDAMAKL